MGGGNKGKGAAPSERHFLAIIVIMAAAEDWPGLKGKLTSRRLGLRSRAEAA
jgi:hypothetical protein